MESKKNNTKQIGLIVGISVIVLAAIIIGAYFIFLGDNKKVFTNALNKTSKEINNTIDKINDKTPNIFDKQVSVDTKIKVNSNKEELSLLNNYNLDLNMGIDYAKELLTLGTKINNKDNKEIVSANLNYISNKIYLEAPKLLNKVILLENDSDTISLFNSDKIRFDYINDIELFTKIIKDSLVNYVTNKDIVTTKETISINNKNHNVKAYSVVLEGEKLKTLLDNIQTNLTNDQTLMNDLATILNVDVKDLQQSIKDNPINLEKIEVVVYQEGILDNYIGGKIILDDMELEVVNYSDYSLITLDDYITITKEDNTYTIDLSKLDNDINNITIKELNSKNYEITINMKESKPIILSILEKEKNNAVITFKYDDLTLELDLTINYDVELPVLDTSKAVNVDDLTENDQNTLIDNLTDIVSEIPELSELFTM